MHTKTNACNAKQNLFSDFVLMCMYALLQLLTSSENLHAALSCNEWHPSYCLTACAATVHGPLSAITSDMRPHELVSR